MNFLRRIRALFRKERLDSEMSEELQFHLDVQAEMNRRAGMTPDEARLAAQRQFGHMDGIKETVRDRRGWLWLEQTMQDLRYAVRALRKTPSFTVTAVLTLAFGIGVNAALFTVFNIVALQSLPVKDPDGLIKIAGQSSKKGGYYPSFPYVEYLAYREGNHVLTDLAAYNEAAIRLDSAPEAPPPSDPLFEVRGPGLIAVQWVSGNYFKVLGAQMSLGRDFLPEETRAPGIAPVIVLSHLFWERHLHRDPNVLGTTISLSRKSYTVVGVAAPDFTGQQPSPPAGWIPLMMWGRAADLGPGGVPAFRIIGRLQPNATEQQAKADLDVIAARLAKESPGEGGQDSVRLERGMRFINIPMNAKTLAALTPLLLGFGMVLVIACTNVANLLLARGVTRQKEIAVRFTLGAGRGRMIRQLLTENLLLCIVGAVVGLALALWTLQILQPIILGRLPAEWAADSRRWYFLKAAPDFRVVGFTTLLALVAALAAGLVPALHAASTDLGSTLKDDGTLFGRRLSQSRLRNLLVIVQVAICLMLLSCAGLLARNLFSLGRLDLGFDPQAVFTVNLTPRTPQADRRAALGAAMITLRTLPGVEAAGMAYRAPLLADSGPAAEIKTTASSLAAVQEQTLRFCYVSSGYFAAMGIPLLHGRAFTQTEDESAAQMVIISESVARRLWPGQEAVGKTLTISESAFNVIWHPGPAGTYRECEVIGVARDTTVRVGHDEHDLMYLPLPSLPSTIFVRPISHSAGALAEITRAADAVGLTLQFNRTMADYLQQALLPYYGLAVLSGLLGGLALLMASVGLYGVMSFAVNQRVREIGIRVALGATAEKVVGLFVRQGMRLVTVGIALGLGGGALFALLLTKIIFGGGGAFDPVAFGGVALIFAAIAWFACWLPARRAAKVDPMIALRAE